MRVQKPARYVGCELGSAVPVHRDDKVSWLIAYPDTYEIGLPNQGIQILCEILNEREDAVAERGYVPWPDMSSEMRAARVPFFSVETHRAAGDFDIVAFNLAAELVYTNVLEAIDLAGVPVRNEERDESHPIVMAGGHARIQPQSPSPTMSMCSSWETAKRSSATSPRH